MNTHLSTEAAVSTLSSADRNYQQRYDTSYPLLSPICIGFENGCWAYVHDPTGKDKIGDGGQGSVYRAQVFDRYDNDLGGYALKCANPDATFGYSLQDQMAMMQRAERVGIDRGEAMLGIPRALGYTRAGGYEYLLLEHIPGESLDRCIERDLPLPTILSITSQLLGTLSVLEQDEIVVGEIGQDTQGKGAIVHGDTRPHNMKFDAATGRVFLLDFGSAHWANEPNSDPGTLWGDVAWASSEASQGDKADPRSSIYAAGCLLLEMLTRGGYSQKRWLTDTGVLKGARTLVFENVLGTYEEDNEELMAQHNIAEPIREVIRKATALKPEDRYQTAEEMRKAIISIQ